MGAGAGSGITTGDFNIDIGSAGTNLDSGTIRIGDSNTVFAVIAGISGAAIMGAPVVVTSGGQLGVSTSSARFKEGIKPMDKASEAILALKPVTFHYKKEIDPKKTAQFGLVAEEVEKVNPALITRDNQGKVYTVRYDAVNAMLLNEFLKEHRKMQEQDRKVQEQGATISQLKLTVARQDATNARQQKDFQAIAANQQKQIEALTAGLQKVSAQVQMSRSAPQTVADNH